MLAMIHFAPWYRQRMALRLPEALRGPVMAQQAQGVDVAATFTTDPIDHLNAGYGNSFDFGQEQ